MNTTARHLMSCLILSLGLGATQVDASAPTTTAMLTAGTFGQNAPDAKKAAQQLLAQARQAMKQGQFDQAAELIRQAESKNAKFSLLDFGDSPTRARRDLENMRKQKTTKPSARFAPWSGGKKNETVPDNPFKDYTPPQTNPTSNSGLPPFGQPNKTPAADIGLKSTKPAGGTTEPIRFGSKPSGAALTPDMFAEPKAATPLEPLPTVDAFGRKPTATPFGKPAVTTPPALAKSPWPQDTRSTNAPKTQLPAHGSETKIGFVGNAPQAAPNNSLNERKRRAMELVGQARMALQRGDRPTAQRLAQHAQALGVPEAAFGPREDRPSLLMYDLNRRVPKDFSARPAGGTIDQTPGNFAEKRAVYDPQRDPSRNVRVADFGQPNQPFAAPLNNPGPAATSPAVYANQNETPMSFYERGEQALAAGNHELAQSMFKAAWKGEAQLSAAAKTRIKNYFMNQAHTPRADKPAGGSLVEQAEAKQRMLAKQLESEIMRRQRTARDVLSKDPKAALEQLKQARATVEASNLKTNHRARLLRRVDREIDETHKYIADNRAQIELDEKNRAILDEIDREQQVKLDVQQKLAEMVDQFNKLNDERRFREAELIVKKAENLAPKDPLVVQLKTSAKFIRRLAQNADLRERSEQGNFSAWQSVEESAIGYDDRIPVTFVDVESWKNLRKDRERFNRNSGRQRTEKEFEIERSLKTPVLMKFEETPLSEVMGHLSKVAGIDIYLDPRGLAAEGVETDTPVTLKLNKEISLKSALSIILSRYQLTYVIEDELLKITSVHVGDNDLYTVTYNVADMVIAIPNFGRQTGMGIEGALNRAMTTANGAATSGGFATPVGAGGYAANQNPGSMNAHLNPTALGQQLPAGTPQPQGLLPGGLGQPAEGGAGQADFDSLIQLITSTVSPTTWDEVGGPGSIAPFATNLSLVVNQTQEVHEQIVDLLKQLRRNQDLQVTIEVRFIDLSDNFFERIGVDFNFLAYDNIPNGDVPDGEGDNEFGPSMTVGFDGSDITGDFEFNQGSFATTIPSAGGVFNPAAAASFGFAVLSDIEAFFFIQAVQSDVRSNTLQAPKVTLFNGQQAFVTNSTQTPFVTSVIPVVGDFAAAHQPVVVVLTEGSSMTVQAVVSPDKRYVRLTVVPFFSKIDSVETFTFTGSETSSSSESEQDDEDGGSSSRSRDDADGREGTTIQLPTFSFQTVTTTVTVPDGGTVLLGGLKSLREARNENGVPILSKIPYVNRLFKNVGIGRETRSLMMMVTPRIIILEEEEAKLLGTRASP